jgi:aldehyde:ferredoxin oxidoreductase
MGYGITSNLVYINLTDGSIRKEIIPDDTYRLYPGGKALAAYLLLKNMPAGIEPLSPENVLVFANGLMTGAPLSTATRFTVAARSPLTGAYGESEAGGFWGPELKSAGFEAIVVYGRAKSPVYININNDQVEILNAEHLWGHDPDYVQETIRQELDDKLIRVLQIGLGGENLVRYAAISHEMRHFNGRTGMGAVMGSKNLKAIAVRGSARYLNQSFDPKGLVELGKTLAGKVKNHPQSWDLQVKGTPGLTSGMNAAGILPTRNFRQGSFEGAANVSWDAYEKDLLKGRGSCHACAVRCKRVVAISARWEVSGPYGGPEYEAIAGFSSNSGIDDISAMAKANELCNRYVLDTISTSSSIAFAMECFERGLIGLDETGGIDLRFGNAEAMLEMIELIAHRQGFGNMLAEGTRTMSQIIGQGSDQFAMQVKGQELAMHDPRGKVAVGLGYAVCETGADHLVSYHDTMIANPESVSFKGAQPLGITEAMPARELSARKAGAYAILENWSSLGKVTGFCYFGLAPRSMIEAEQVQAAVKAATGWDLSVPDMLQIGERATNLARIFNIREGFSRQDDTLPERLFMPLENGPLNGVCISKTEFTQALTDLYITKGWDPASGAPTPERLRELGIEWAIDLLPETQRRPNKQ